LCVRITSELRRITLEASKGDSFNAAGRCAEERRRGGDRTQWAVQETSVGSDSRWGWEVVDGLSTMEQVEKIPRCTDFLLSVSDRTPPDLAHGVGMGSTR